MEGQKALGLNLKYLKLKGGLTGLERVINDLLMNPLQHVRYNFWYQTGNVFLFPILKHLKPHGWHDTRTE